jgi:hypothetical protein
MSGGHFDYKQYQLEYIADEIEHIILSNDLQEKDVNGCSLGWHFSPETIEKFKLGRMTLLLAQIYVQRIDWLVSGDDGEDSFHRRLGDDIDALDRRLGDFDGLDVL